MTRTELMKFAKEQYNNNFNFKRETRVNKCNAWIIDFDYKEFALLKSYNTIVGIYSYKTGTLYIFNYYSATTYQHIYKASKLLKADRITWLYQKSDNIIETALSIYANTIKLKNSQFRNLEEHDYSCYIETRAFR